MTVLAAELAFERYVDDVLVTDPSRLDRAVRVPRNLLPMQLDELERALADPRVLFIGGVDAPEVRVEQLFAFALWLKYAPRPHVPAHLASRAARLRFVVWSLLPRLNWNAELRPPHVQWTPTSSRPRPEDYVAISEGRVLAEAIAAREEWLAYLDGWEDDPWLATRHEADPTATEFDLRWLTTTWPRPARGQPAWPGQPSVLDLEDGGRPAQDRLALTVGERHWLPRGSAWSAAAALSPGSRLSGLLPLLFPLPALVVAVLYAVGLVGPARWGALGLVVGGVLFAAASPVRLTVLALLRIPAATAVGEVVLLSLTPRWWLAPFGWTVGVGLLAFSFGYLALEARMHGASAVRAYRRGAVVAVVGALYAFLLSVVVLGFLAPAVAERGDCLQGWWTVSPWSARMLPPGCDELTKGTVPASAEVLLLMTGWSLALGLAAQVLWDDRPVTAPLARIRRGRGAP